MIGKCDFDPIPLHGEQSHMACIASEHSHVNNMLVFDGGITLSECNWPLRIEAFSISVTSQAVLIGRRMEFLRASLVVAMETYLHIRPISSDAAMGYFGVTGHTIDAHFVMHLVMRVHFSRRSNRLDYNVGQAPLFPEFRVLDAVYETERDAQRHDSITSNFFIHLIGVAEEADVIFHKLGGISGIGGTHEDMHLMIWALDELAVDVIEAAHLSSHVSNEARFGMTVEALHPGPCVYRLLPGSYLTEGAWFIQRMTILAKGRVAREMERLDADEGEESYQCKDDEYSELRVFCYKATRIFCKPF